MSDIWLNVTASPGSSIKDCAKKSVEIASRLGVTVFFDFNGVTCLAIPGTDSEDLVKSYEDALKNNGVICSSNPNKKTR